jgi:hypothetical protein
MPEHLPVELKFFGAPFDRQAVIHTLRHLAMRTGWTITPRAQHRIIYATTEDPAQITAGEGDIVILSTPAVKGHLAEDHSPFPFEIMPEGRFPFPHPKWCELNRRGWISADIVAGACAVLNLWYEGRNRSKHAGDWILFAEDWWQKAGWERPEPVVDQWLGVVHKAASILGWPQCNREWQPTILLTHDVDYLPTRFNRGLPRFLRSVARQVITRRRPGDVLLNVRAYAKALMHALPYSNFDKITAGETARGACSSFQFAVRRDHAHDPAYDLNRPDPGKIMQYLKEKGFEICLHGSYRAGDDPARLAEEKVELERLSGQKIVGHRQHYLHFHPHSFFAGIEKAGLRYDMSIGYNDRVGPRAGTYFPYRPYNLDHERHFSFWEIPLVLMDTTLATSSRLSSPEAVDAGKQEIRRFMEMKGCVSIVWHQEQLSGILDPGYDRVYWDLLDYLRERQVRMTTGNRILSELDALWDSTFEE